VIVLNEIIQLGPAKHYLKAVALSSSEKKGDKLDCKNYGGICLVNVAYKVFAKVLQNCLLPYNNIPAVRSPTDSAKI
jgi:hypothetical protein